MGIRRTSHASSPTARRVGSAGALLFALAFGPAGLASAVDGEGDAADATDAEFVDGIAAQVGSDIVLASEVYRFAAPVEKKMRQAGAPEQEIIRMRADLLERMIERRLVEQAVRRIEIDASEGEIDAAIASIAEQNGLTAEQLRKTVEAKGMTYDAYRDQIRGEIQRQKLISGAVQANVRVEEEEVRALYKKRYADQPEGGQEVRLRHILVPFGADTGIAESQACDEVSSARERVLAGEDFALIAADISAVNAEYGGDVGWVHVANLSAWMSVPVSELKKGQVSDVIRMPFGCNLLYLEERREFQPKTYEQARRGLSEEIYDQKMGKEYQSFVDVLREQTFIERKGVFADAAPAFTDSYEP